MTKPKIGKIIVPYGALPHPHELNVAKLLVFTGYDVKFIPTSIHVSSDIEYQKLIWEIKSPIGRSSRTIENNLRNALHQSTNIILDLTRIKLSQDNCLRYLKNHMKNFHQIKRLIIVTKDKQLLNFSQRDACFHKISMIKSK